MSERLKQLQELQNDLGRDLTNRELFAKVISAAIALVIEERDLAKVLSTSRTTINRWKNGNVMPHAMVVKIVVKELKTRVTSRLNHERRLAAGGTNSGYGSAAAGDQDF